MLLDFAFIFVNAKAGAPFADAPVPPDRVTGNLLARRY